MIRVHTARFARETDGGLAIYGLILFMSICVLIGLSMDVANGYKVRSEMQVAADTAAHTALVNRLRYGKDLAITKAVEVAGNNLSTSNAGANAVKTTDIVFGRWDDATRTFTPDASSTTAVMVTARRSPARGNPVNTFLLSTIGLDAWSVTTQSVMETYRPPCLREGFVAEKIVDIQSNNGFENGFCIHSNSGISINQNNYFEAGTVVSMPDLDNLDIAASGFVKNEGLLEALRESFYKIRILNRIGDINTALAAGDVETLRQYTAGGDSADTLDYLTSGGVVTVALNKTIKATDLVPNRINIVTCQGGKLTFDKSAGTFKNFAMLTSCQLDVTVGPDFEDVLMSTTNTAEKSITAPAGSAKDPTNLGKNDSCAEGGGVNLVTLGGIDMASGINAYGVQLMAVGDVNFSANANGVEGISIISGGRIDGTSNMKMGFCGNGNDHNLEIDYYRLAA
jgi:Flp pilus assembly protein TadG